MVRFDQIDSFSTTVSPKIGSCAQGSRVLILVSGFLGGPWGAPEQGKEMQVKFEIQVYKMKDDRYMIEFQRMDGGVMSCMDMAAAVSRQLRLA